MMYMEIALLPRESLKIKGKHASIVVNPQDKTQYNAALLIGMDQNAIKLNEDTVLFNGPGEYEAGGIKITGIKNNENLAYSIIVDGIDMLIGQLSALEKMQQKLNENSIVIALTGQAANADFLTSLTSHVIIFSGAGAKETARTLEKDEVKSMSKYQITLDKLPAEIETVVLE